VTSKLNCNFYCDPRDLAEESVLFGASSAMQEVRDQVERICSSNLPVLIRGESGTGKELIARYIHFRSPLRDAAFVKLNCAAIPSQLLESELLGYEKGAFTGAHDVKRGLVEIADGGTLFLDEIGDMEFSLQTKLLHLLQDGQYTRIGGREDRRASVRVLSATNCDLESAIEARRFRQDLFYRIDVVSLHLAPLRERKEDIPTLTQFFLEKLSRKFGRTAPPLKPTVLHLLAQWDWPGNMRELENWVARYIILGADHAVAAELHRHVLVAQESLDRSLDNFPNTPHLKEASRRAAVATERAVILKTLQANNWNRKKTALELGMSYRSLLYKLRDAGVPPRRRLKTPAMIAAKKRGAYK